MIAGVYKIVCDQGATFERLMTIKDHSANPINLTGYTARMQVRPEIESSDVLVELTTENGRLVMGGVAGTIAMNLGPAVTATIDRDGFYDLEIISNGGAVHRVLRGRFVVNLEVTR